MLQNLQTENASKLQRKIMTRHQQTNDQQQDKMIVIEQSFGEKFTPEYPIYFHV